MLHATPERSAMSQFMRKLGVDGILLLMLACVLAAIARVALAMP